MATTLQRNNLVDPLQSSAMATPANGLLTPAMKELQVGLCGRTAKVPLRANEGIGEFRTRVAGAFGLTAPFDLVGPEGVLLRNDADTARAAAAAEAAPPPQVNIDAGEEALLDLERAHEESSALRWVLLRKVLAGLRTQIAEAVIAISESKHQNAMVVEQMGNERSRREASEASLRMDVQALAENMLGEIHRGRQEMQTAISTTVADLEQRTKTAIGAQAEACRTEMEALQEKLRTVEECRQRQGDEFLRNCEDIRFHHAQQTQTHMEAFEKITNTNTALEAKLGSEREERLGSEVRIENAVKSLNAEWHQVNSRHDIEFAAVKTCIAELRTAIDAEVVTRNESAGYVAKQIQEMSMMVEAHKIAIEERLTSQFGTIESTVHGLIGDEAATREAADMQREKAIGGLVEGLQQEFAVLRVAQERVEGAVSSAIDTAACTADAAARKDAEWAAATAEHERTLAEHERTLGEFVGRLEVEERCRASDTSALRAECLDIRGALVGERNAWDAACKEISATETAQREELRGQLASEGQHWRAAQTEACRDWTRQLVEQTAADLRKEHENLLHELRQHCDDLINKNFSSAHTEFGTVMQRIDTMSATLGKTQDDALREHQAYYDNQARAAAKEVKAALEAHAEFAEGLESAQRLLVQRLNENLTQEGVKRDRFIQRVKALEVDMHQVRGHLPILFAAPSGFK